MFSLLKSVFRRKHTSEDVSKSSSHPVAVMQADAPSAPGEHDQASVPGTRADVIELPFKAIINCLPPPLQSQLRKPPGRQAHLALPVKTTLAQLPKGSVKLTFKEIKAFAPPGTFLTTTPHDNVLVELPLQEILARLKPEQMSRRSGQRRVEVPHEVSALFGPAGSVNGAVRIAVAPASPFTAPGLPASNRAVSLPSGTPSYLRNGTHPSAPIEEPAPEVVARPTVAPSAPLPRPSEPLIAKVQPVQTPLRPGIAEVVAVQINQVGAHWPETLRAALARRAVDDRTMHIPLAEIEPALKRGKIVFTWKQIRSWVVPHPVNWFPEHDSLPLEFPLSVIAPLFMDRRRDLNARSKSFVPSSIPDIFSPFAQTGLAERSSAHSDASPSRGSLRPSSPAPPATSVVAPISAPSSLPAAPINRISGTEKTESLSATPAAIIEHARRLPGVSGALIGTDDGLLIAANLGESLSAETMAAFLPQMYQRLAQYAREMKIGEPSQLVIVADSRPLAVFKGPGTYFAVVGNAGESLPEAPIKALALRLRQSTTNA